MGLLLVPGALLARQRRRRQAAACRAARQEVGGGWDWSQLVSRAHGCTYPGLVSPHVPRHSLPSTLDRPASSLSCLSLLRYIGCCAVSFGLKPGFVTWGTPKSLGGGVRAARALVQVRLPY